MLVSGHCRRVILQDMGVEEVDAVEVDYDEPTHYARMIAANRQAGKFEEELLASLAKEIEGAGLSAGLAGFDEAEFASLLAAPEPVDDSEEAERLIESAAGLQEQWKVQPGDLFEIGPHRLLCGDCSDPESWARLLQGGQADMVWTDPPYNVDYADLMNDNLPEDDYAGLMQRAFATLYQVTKPGGAIYVAHADSYGLLTRAAVREAGWYLAQCLIWVKSSFVLGRQDHHWQHEPILYGWKPGASHYWQGGFSQATVIDEEPKATKLSKAELVRLVEQLRNERNTTVIREPKLAVAGLHPTIKPLALVARQVWNSSRRGETVAEPFGGSGTTMAAAEQTGRRCVATELDPKYCAVILERMKSYGLEIKRQNGN